MEYDEFLKLFGIDELHAYQREFLEKNVSVIIARPKRFHNSSSLTTMSIPKPRVRGKEANLIMCDDVLPIPEIVFDDPEIVFDKKYQIHSKRKYKTKLRELNRDEISK